MRRINLFGSMLVTALPAIGSAFAQGNAPPADNATLRYWAAFSELQDDGIAEQQDKAINAILDGFAPYDDSKYGKLLEKNRLALEMMARGALFRNCDWVSITAQDNMCLRNMQEERGSWDG